MSSQKLVRVFTAADEIEAQLVQGLLQTAGIESVVDSHAPPSVLPFALQKPGQIHILVSESQSGEAAQILSEQHASEPEEEG